MENRIQAAAWPVLERRRVELTNRLLHLSRRLKFRVGNSQYCMLFPNQTVRSTVLGLDLQVGAEVCYLDFQRYPFMQEIRTFLDGGSLSNLESFLAVAVLENVLAPLFAELGELLLCDISITSVHMVNVPQRKKDSVSIAIEGGEFGSRIMGRFSASDHFLVQMIEHLQEADASSSTKWDALPFKALVMLGRTELPHHVYLELEPGDVILLDQQQSASPSSSRQTLHLPGFGDIVGHLQERRFTVEELQMNQKNNDINRWDVLPVNLGFELGEHQMELGLLEQVRPGFVFNLHTSFEKPVTIRANGRVIGRGDIVRIDDQLAVRILDLKLPQSLGEEHHTEVQTLGVAVDPDAVAHLDALPAEVF